jgi:D-sedoheptulose 7-phosphate isomerase
MSVAAPNTDFFTDYASRLQASLATAEWSGVAQLAADIHECWLQKR